MQSQSDMSNYSQPPPAAKVADQPAVKPQLPHLSLEKLPSILPSIETSPTVSLHLSPVSSCPEAEDLENGHQVLHRIPSAPSPYLSLPPWRKKIIVFTTSFTALTVTFASTSLNPVTLEVAESLNTTSAVILITNSLVLLTMGCSNFVWGPITRIFGRKKAWLAACVIFTLCTLGTCLVPEDKGHLGLRVFIAMRILSGIQGTFFHVAGQTWLADCFEPKQRGMATGFFLCGTIFGPAFGPCVAGIIVTFATWRAVLWLQVSMIGTAFLLSLFFLPDIERPDETVPAKSDSRLLDSAKTFNPGRIFKPMLYPNVTFTHVTCGFLSWCQYTLLAAPRHLLNPRFNLTTPLVSGLFYIAPGVGFLLGTVIGGKFSDMTVIKWIRIRGGIRLPQDRLHSGMISFFFLIPISSLIYGWGLEYQIGGMALPIVTAFFCAMGLTMAFSSVNTYCAEVLPKRRTEVIAGKYLVQYTSAAIGSASIVPLIDAIGVGPATTIGVVFALSGGVLVLATARYGLRMQQWIERRHRFLVTGQVTATI
ncbi:major facilitator superfamily domain-containing protein [Pseudomassariella vexata]|uniref:Major facilitator superfamily domain-containing protein n=1 Tax=Pseudomassariella vexata TaxID=1141098 RepID=A0A1Y2E033_9PEZI|nr:major facilitator superfamily domain-containing protein [Pseudomassariella vexata]ORY64839.1 major facilitator superfamily domain-containing protein [Pseudomassariella vexata]